MIIAIIAIDQIIKFVVVKNLYNTSVSVIKGILKFTYIENTGGAYGIGSKYKLIFILLNAVTILLIGRFILSKKSDISISILFALGLIVAGGIGNFIDRMFRGFVVDFIDFNPLIKYPVFNFADICVVLGCLIITVDLITNIIKERTRL